MTLIAVGRVIPRRAQAGQMPRPRAAKRGHPRARLFECVVAALGGGALWGQITFGATRAPEGDPQPQVTLIELLVRPVAVTALVHFRARPASPESSAPPRAAIEI